MPPFEKVPKRSAKSRRRSPEFTLSSHFNGFRYRAGRCPGTAFICRSFTICVDFSRAASATYLCPSSPVCSWVLVKSSPVREKYR